jgi:predicted metal-dependent phosphotriesterase family hydrolase
LLCFAFCRASLVDVTAVRRLACFNQQSSVHMAACCGLQSELFDAQSVLQFDVTTMSSQVGQCQVDHILSSLLPRLQQQGVPHALLEDMSLQVI